MQRLKGKDILLGREPGDGRLCLTVAGQKAYIGSKGSVPGSVSRCLADKGIAHAKITVDGEGNVFIANMKMQNETFVNGLPIMSKRINPSDKVELGPDRYSVPMTMLMNTCIKMVKQGDGGEPTPPRPPRPPQPPQKIYSVRHLKFIWEDYKKYRDEIKDRQKTVNLVRTGCSALAILSVPCVTFIGKIGFIFTGIGVIGAIYGFFAMKNDDSSEKLEKLNEDFQLRYVCPNPDCGRFLGNYSYRVMLRNYKHQCPYCKNKFIE